MKSPAEVLRWAALRTLPAVKREIFLNAATVLLDLDPRTKGKDRPERSAMLRGDFESLEKQAEAIKRLEQAIINVGKDIEAENWGADWDEIKKLPDGEFRRRGRRILAATFIRKALRGTNDEHTFSETTNLLFQLQRDVTFDRDRENGKNELKRISRRNVLERLEKAAADLRQEKPALKTKSQRANWLLKHGFSDIAPNPKALIELARRSDIEI